MTIKRSILRRRRRRSCSVAARIMERSGFCRMPGRLGRGLVSWPKRASLLFSHGRAVSDRREAGEVWTGTFVLHVWAVVMTVSRCGRVGAVSVGVSAPVLSYSSIIVQRRSLCLAKRSKRAKTATIGWLPTHNLAMTMRWLLLDWLTARSPGRAITIHPRPALW